MLILGIDPGTATTGFGAIETDGNDQEMVQAGVIRTKADTPAEKRLQKIYENLQEIIGETKPQEIAIERLFFAQNVTTAMSVSQARGVVLLAAAQNDLQTAEYTPNQIKQAVTGHGHAEKHQMQTMVATLLGLAETPKPDDAADALAVALCHAASSSHHKIDQEL